MLKPIVVAGFLDEAALQGVHGEFPDNTAIPEAVSWYCCKRLLGLSGKVRATRPAVSAGNRMLATLA